MRLFRPRIEIVEVKKYVPGDGVLQEAKSLVTLHSDDGNAERHNVIIRLRNAVEKTELHYSNDVRDVDTATRRYKEVFRL